MYTFVVDRSQTIIQVTLLIFIGNLLKNVLKSETGLMKYLLCILPVAKRSSVFDDPTTEIQELTAVIKQDITALNSAVVDLQFVCNSQNESANISTDTTTHSATVVDNLKNRLMSATKEFKEVLTMRTEVYQLSPFCIASVLAVYGIIVALLLELFFSVLLL